MPAKLVGGISGLGFPGLRIQASVIDTEVLDFALYGKEELVASILTPGTVNGTSTLVPYSYRTLAIGPAMPGPRS